MKNAQIAAEDCRVIAHGAPFSSRNRLNNTNTAISNGATAASTSASERRSL